MKESTMKGIIGGIVIGAIAATGLTIGTGFSVVRAEADQMVADGINEAKVEAFANICLATYEALPDADKARHKEAMQKLEVFKQRDYIKTAGWSVMPGDSNPFRTTTDVCQEKIEATF